MGGGTLTKGQPVSHSKRHSNRGSLTSLEQSVVLQKSQG